jgi:hypothetical protein
MTIPALNANGVLPPVRPAASGNDLDRSPYPVDLATLVDRFAKSPERIAILNGMLAFRAALHEAGIVCGFQWFDGSFLEDVETLESRPPRDMDVVTFFDLPEVDQQELVNRHGALFNHGQVKESYAMDAYFVQIGGPLDKDSIRRVTYWYSMWSHRRNGLWKGFVQVDLNPAQDAEARALLDCHGGTP